MENIYSKSDFNLLLHIIVRKEEFAPGRTEVIDANNFMQCALLNMNMGKTFRPHFHIHKNRTYNIIAQESWVVIQGSVKCILYDIDNTIIATPILSAGDASFTLMGGHTYEILEDETLVFEYKTGPYEGQEFDKQFIEN